MKKFLKNLGSAIASPFVNFAKTVKYLFIKLVRKIKTAWIYLTNKEERQIINAKIKLKRKNRVKQPKVDMAFDVVNAVVMITLIIVTVVPFMHVIACAFSEGEAMANVLLFPKVVRDGRATFGITFEWFEFVLFKFPSEESPVFFSALKNTAIITVVVTLGSNTLMALAAYPLSKSDCPFKKPIMGFFIVLMLFSAGIYPIYILFGENGLNLVGENGIYGIILISMMNVFNMLLFKTTFEGIPKELEESARMDGATNLQMFFKIIIPITVPTFASCCFFTLVGCINSYGMAVVLIRNGYENMPLAQIMFLLQEIIAASSSQGGDLASNATNITSAAILLNMLPILIVYPFIIKYIKTGVTLGSVKG